MQAGRPRRALRPIAAHRTRLARLPRLVGFVLVAVLVFSAVPGASACCRPEPPHPAAGRTVAAATSATAEAAVASVTAGFEVSPAVARATRPHCSDEPANLQTPRIEAPDYRPPSSAAHADGVLVFTKATGMRPGRPALRPEAVRAGSGPPLWLRTCVSRT